MRRAERNYKAILECERDITPHECTRSFAEVTNVVLPIVHVVLDDQVPVPNALVLVLLNHKIVVDVPLDGLLKCAKDRASVVFAAR